MLLFTNRVIKIVQIFLVLTKSVLFMFVDWISRHVVFFSNQWTDLRRRKNLKTPVNVLPMVFQNVLGNKIEILFN